MSVLIGFLGLCLLTVAFWGLLYVATGQHHIRRRLRANQREHDRQMREFAHKEAAAPLERELGIKNSLTGQLLHPKPRKRLAYHPATGELVEPGSFGIISTKITSLSDPVQRLHAEVLAGARLSILGEAAIMSFGDPSPHYEYLDVEIVNPQHGTKEIRNLAGLSGEQVAVVRAIVAQSEGNNGYDRGGLL